MIPEKKYLVVLNPTQIDHPILHRLYLKYRQNPIKAVFREIPGHEEGFMYINCSGWSLFRFSKITPFEMIENGQYLLPFDKE